MKKNLLSTLLLMCALFGSSFTATAQFNFDSTQTFFVCNATGIQQSVSAFGDGNGGTYSFWIDKRNGNAGTAIYGQHLDSLGNPQWAANGKLFYQENAKEVWLMKAVAWQSGILLGWVQGGFGIGGDTLYCNYYNSNGVSQWAQPTVAANKQGNIIYVGFDDMDLYPNDSGATVTFSLSPSGGNNYFSFNRINFSGNLRWPLDTFSYQGNGYYYHTGYDNHNGFYVATSTGGLGTPIYIGHYDLHGNLTIPTPLDITGTAGGRNNSQWKVLCDNDTNAYVVWASYANQDISINKIRPNGVLPWANAKPICAATGYQEYPDAIIKNDTIYAIWDDARPNAANYYVYMQKIDKSGNMLWTPDGIQLSNLNSYIPYPKLAVSGINVMATFLVNNKFRGQKIRPDSTITWNQNGLAINIPNLPFYGDYQLVPSSNGAVTAIWHDQGDNICAARIGSNGTLTNIIEQKENLIGLFPNPATDHFSFSLQEKNALISIYNSKGELVFQTKNTENASGTITVNTKNFPAGVYNVNVTGVNFNSSTKVCIVH